ncbi:hypothetical protein [Halapricum desulfuricans]|uniref:hypothetical protein n=1 Tax=Halapricum desulfuricans TaxID=2841257 RepID=UPI001E3CC74A|nr:hypothetical protein [Halapricum desulfuricans]
MELNRRQYLATLGTTASALALAGCSGDSNGSEDGDGDSTDTPTSGPTGNPVDIIETWHSALDDGDIDTANNLIHENASEETGVTEITEGQGEFYNGNSVTLDNTEIVEEDDNVVVVEVTTTVAGNTETSTLELRSQDGAWKVYGIRDE